MEDGGDIEYPFAILWHLMAKSENVLEKRGNLADDN